MSLDETRELRQRLTKAREAIHETRSRMRTLANGVESVARELARAGHPTEAKRLFELLDDARPEPPGGAW